MAEANFELFKNIFMKCEDIRCLGSASIALAYVAAGRLDAYIEKGLKPWDFAAGLLLVQDVYKRQVLLHVWKNISPTPWRRLL